MKMNPRFYHVLAKVENDRDIYIVWTYTTRIDDNFVCMDFYRLSQSTNDDDFAIPSDRQATFQEEIRILNQAPAIMEGQRDEEIEIIKSKIEEIYDKKVTVKIKEVTKDWLKEI